MDKLLILFTMKGCPFCEIMKEQLNREEIEFYDRDIEIYEEEYEMFKEITGNDFVPAFMVVESLDDEPITHLYAPERDFNEIEEGVSIIKELFNR
jgi:glutaredoxin